MIAHYSPFLYSTFVLILFLNATMTFVSDQSISLKQIYSSIVLKGNSIFSYITFEIEDYKMH